MSEVYAPPYADLATALVAFQAELPAVRKAITAKVEHRDGGSHTYTYADLAEVSREVMPVLTRHGLSFTAEPRRTNAGDYELVGVLQHSSGERSTGALPLFGRSPQEIGSSITYMRRYLLLCMTGVPTDDDDGRSAASAPRTHQQNPPTSKALLVAKQAVFEAWKAQHGDWDGLAAQVDFEAFSGGGQLTDASAEDLTLYARHLGGERW